jgi:phosphoglycerate dehydrogenase-like enzyme
VPVEAVAEYAVSALLMLLKDFPVLQRRPQDLRWYSSPAVMLQGSTVLVLGAGRIGRGVVRRLDALGARCVAATATGTGTLPGGVRVIGPDAVLDAAATADHVICCLPATTGTANLVDKELLGLLRPHAALVNVGRASTVDHDALYDALRAGELRGAFLDVHRVEPLSADDPAWAVPNLVVSPHRAFAFPGEPAEVGRAFLDNLSDLRAGRAPRDVVAFAHEGEQ